MDRIFPELNFHMSKRRSRDHEHQELEVYVAGTHVGPQPHPNVQEAEKAAQVACRKNLM